MKKKAFICVLSVILVLSVFISSVVRQPEPEVTQTSDSASYSDRTLDFSLALLNECAKEGENVLISPLCASGALSAAALGASGDTRSQLDQVLGGSAEKIAARSGETLSDNGGVSIWVNNDGRITLSPDYVSSVENILDASVESTDFSTVLDKMNSWVSETTDGKVDSVIDEIPPQAVAYILSALTFEGEWLVPYTPEKVADGQFVSSDGTKYDVQFMKSTENIYIETDTFKGFAKPYSDGSYFIALLPDEDVSMTDLLSSLNGTSFDQLMNSATNDSVSVCIPKFTAENKLSLCEALINMGASDAFSREKADFSAMGSDTLYITEFVQSTFISVDEKGTQGGAGSGIEVSLKGMPSFSVVLDRPFAYFVVKDGDMFFAGVLERV